MSTPSDQGYTPTSNDNAVYSTYNDWQNNVTETSYLYNTQLANQQQSMEKLLNTMGSVGASVAFNILIPILMLKVNGTNNTQMDIEASQSNEESDVLTLTNITQSDDNYLASNSSTFTAAEDTAPADRTQDQNNEIATYNNKYNQAQDAQLTLNSMFSDNSDASSANYGWCDQSYADNMLTARASWQSATNNLSTVDPSNPPPASSPTTPVCNYAYNISSYASDPTDSTFAPDVTNLTTSLNTETSSNNSVQSQLQGMEKTQIAIGQQYLSGSKSSGKTVIDEKSYWVQKQIAQ